MKSSVDRGHLRDLAGRDDIETLTRAFYQQAFADDLLGPMFVNVLMNVDAHLPVIRTSGRPYLFGPCSTGATP